MELCVQSPSNVYCMMFSCERSLHSIFHGIMFLTIKISNDAFCFCTFHRVCKTFLWSRSLIAAGIHPLYWRARTHKYLCKTCKLLPSMKWFKPVFLLKSHPPQTTGFDFSWKTRYRWSFARSPREVVNQNRSWIWQALSQTWYWLGPVHMPLGLDLQIPEGGVRTDPSSPWTQRYSFSISDVALMQPEHRMMQHTEIC